MTRERSHSPDAALRRQVEFVIEEKSAVKFGFQLLLSAAIVSVLTITWAFSALAHSEFVSSVPAPNSTVTTAPTTVKATYNAGINPKGSSIAVVGPNGSAADVGDGHVDLNDPNRQTMIVTLKPNLGPGKYTVKWTTVAADDGDTLSDTFTFTIAAAAPVATTTPKPTATAAVPATLPKTGGVPIPFVVGSAVVLAIVGFGLRRVTSHDRTPRRRE
jgi:methionine-rich copper-binding protein CopC